MKSNYKRIGDFIRPIKVKNIDGSDKSLLGININKYFMPSVANVVGTDLSKYKIVKKGQFSCNRMHVGRDKRLPVALSNQEDDFIVSPAYDVFEITDKDILLPVYLMMWFSRKEFDRNAWFYTDADVRGGLHWDAFCNMQLPVPDIEKQKAIVKEYNTIVNRIKLNEQLNQKLEETAQAIYKEWFVDFEFPMSKEYAESIGKPELEGKAYKSNGGEMVWNEELGKDIPVGWRGRRYEEVMNFSTGKLNSNAAIPNGKYPFFTCSNETFKTNTFSYDTEAILLAGNNASAIYPLKYFIGKFDVYQRTYVIIPSDNCLSHKQIYFSVKDELENFKGVSSGTTTKFLTMKILNDLKIVISNKTTAQFFKKLIDPVFKKKLILEKEFEQLLILQDLLLSKMAKA